MAVSAGKKKKVLVLKNEVNTAGVPLNIKRTQSGLSFKKAKSYYSHVDVFQNP